MNADVNVADDDDVADVNIYDAVTRIAHSPCPPSSGSYPSGRFPILAGKRSGGLKRRVRFSWRALLCEVSW